MKNLYTKPTLEFVKVGEDIITTSVGDKTWDLPEIQYQYPLKEDFAINTDNQVSGIVE